MAGQRDMVRYVDRRDGRRAAKKQSHTKARAREREENERLARMLRLGIEGWDGDDE